MKEHVQDCLQQALNALEINYAALIPLHPNIQIEWTRDSQHGDFASNVAMLLAKSLKRNPRELAEAIKEKLPQHPLIARVEIAGPGFINFFMQPYAFQSVISRVLDTTEHYGRSNIGAQQRVIVEFVSANPNGPLHVGHGRGAAFGSVVSSILSAAGFQVHREYYVNDAGRQMDILAVSLWLRYLELLNEKIIFPENGYKGDYVKTIARQLYEIHGAVFLHPANTIFKDLPLDLQPDGQGDKDSYIDALIVRAKSLLGEKAYGLIHGFGLECILRDIREDLEEFGVTFDEWFHESSLKISGVIDREIAELKKAGHLYEKEGALWFKATEFGDEKDRVLIRANGVPTYFASDVAYHLDKYERGFDQLIDIFGADHHGYIARVRASMKALNQDPEKFKTLLVQFAVLYRGKERVQMSTRSGSFVTLRELREEVGKDAARYFYVMRKSDQHMDFDLDLAKSQSNDNPVYYIQYAHARICSVFRQLHERQGRWNKESWVNADQCRAGLETLTEPQERTLLVDICRYSEVIESSALAFEPHQLAYFLLELATHFHAYYNLTSVLNSEGTVREARLALCEAVRQVLQNGLTILGISAPEKM